MKLYICIMVYISVFAFGARANTEMLNLSTVINLNELYAGSISSVYFSESDFELTHDGRVYEPVNTQMHIETTIPEDVVGIMYLTNLIKNETTCYDYLGGQDIQPDYVMVKLDGEELVLNTPISNSFVLSEGGVKKNTHSVELSFKPFSEIVMGDAFNAERCSGELIFDISVDI